MTDLDRSIEHVGSEINRILSLIPQSEGDMLGVLLTRLRLLEGAYMSLCDRDPQLPEGEVVSGG